MPDRTHSETDAYFQGYEAGIRAAEKLGPDTARLSLRLAKETLDHVEEENEKDEG
jgi:hypothetical protein